MQLTIAKKIVLGYVVLLVLLVVISTASYLTFAGIHSEQESVERAIFFKQKEIDHLRWMQGLEKFILNNEKFTGQLDYKQCSFGKWLYGEELNKVKDKNVLALIEEIKAPHKALHDSAQEIIKLKSIGENELALEKFKNTTVPSLEKITASLTEIASFYEAEATESLKQVDQKAHQGETMIAILSILAIGIGSVLAVIISRSISTSLNAIINQLNAASEQVASASNQLSASSQMLAEGSTEQASSIEETSATLEETSSMVRQNTENTKQAAQLSKLAKEAAQKGNTEMAQMMVSMEELKKSSDQISKIIKVIDEIAFQTNILALNAAVEAARAGEAGQGFAVVAEEVRNLAQRSAQAAKDTATIIERNIDLSEQGVAVSQQVNEALNDINVQSQKVNDLLDEIAAASQEQAQGIEQINKAISQMEQVVQANASTAEQSASASAELSSQAASMNDIVNSLISLVKGVQAAQKGAHAAISRIRRPSVKKIAHAPHSAGRQIEARNTNTALPAKKDGTKLVNPEDIIPLEDDTSGF